MPMDEDGRARARDRVLYQLKTKGELSAAEVAKQLGVTAMAVRQHLAILEEEELVAHTDERRKVGRPARIWRLTQAGSDRFPDSHSELTLDLIDAVRSTFGEDGLDKLIGERSKRQLRAYRRHMPGREASVEERVAALCRMRRDEGYMAEWSREPDGGWLLVENHCPICAAARVCQGLCRDELSLFRTVLGKEVSVERTEHVLAEARRCAYRITPRARPRRARVKRGE